MKVQIFFKIRNQIQDVCLTIGDKDSLVDLHSLFMEDIKTKADESSVGELYACSFFFPASHFALDQNLTVSDLIPAYRSVAIAESYEITADEYDLRLRLAPVPPTRPRPKAKKNLPHSSVNCSIREVGLLYMYKWSKPRCMVLQSDVLYLYSDLSSFANEYDPLQILSLRGCRPYSVETPVDGKYILVLQCGDINYTSDKTGSNGWSFYKNSKSDDIVHLTRTDQSFLLKNVSGDPLYQPYATTFTMNELMHPPENLFVFAFDTIGTRDIYFNTMLRAHRRNVLDLSIQCILQLKLRKAQEQEGIFRISGSKTTLDVVYREIYKGWQVDLTPGAIRDEHVISGILKHSLRNTSEPAMSFQGYEFWSKIYDYAEAAVKQDGNCTSLFKTIVNRGTEPYVHNIDSTHIDEKLDDDISDIPPLIGETSVSRLALQTLDEELGNLNIEFDPNMDDDDRLNLVLTEYIKQGLRQLHPQSRALLYLIFTYLHELLQYKNNTRMDSKNYAIVFGVNILRSHPSVASLDTTAARMSGTPASPLPAPQAVHKPIGGANMFMLAPGSDKTPTNEQTPVSSPAPTPTASNDDGKKRRSVLSPQNGEQGEGMSTLRRGSVSTGISGGVNNFFSRGSVFARGSICRNSVTGSYTPFMSDNTRKRREPLADLITFMIDNAPTFFDDKFRNL